MNIRKVKTEDAEALLALQNQLDHETSFMLYEPGERTVDAEHVRLQLERIEGSEHEEIFIAEENKKLVGLLQVKSGSLRRNRSCASIAVGILKDFHNQGIGTRLFKTLDEWAGARSIRRLELAVMEHNRAAMTLYAKVGFQVEGMRKQSLYVDGAFINEFYMAKVIE